MSKILYNMLVFPGLKKPINKKPRESVIPIFVLKPGKYPAIKRHSVNEIYGVECLLIKIQKIKKRR